MTRDAMPGPMVSRKWRDDQFLNHHMFQSCIIFRGTLLILVDNLLHVRCHMFLLQQRLARLLDRWRHHNNGRGALLLCRFDFLHPNGFQNLMILWRQTPTIYTVSQFLAKRVLFLHELGRFGKRLNCDCFVLRLLR